MGGQTTRFTLAGEVTDLFSHMALWGLARICTDMGLTEVRCWWTDEPEPRATLSVADADTTEVAQAVQGHAELRAAEGSWLRETFSLDPEAPEATIGLLAPRTAAPRDGDQWSRLDDACLAARDCLQSDLDTELLLGLGYRSWWAVDRNGNMRADRGCSVWEMRTRNRGTDLVADRLLPLARHVAGWSSEKIWDGLSGANMDDSTSGGKSDSRSSTGFRLPGPVDSARAWCALWALSLFPVIADSQRGGASPAYLPLAGGESARHLLLVPVTTAPTSVPRMAALTRSRWLVDAVDSGHRRTRGPQDLNDIQRNRRAARARLRGRGVLGIMQFPVRVVGSASAPERQTLAGSFVGI